MVTLNGSSYTANYGEVVSGVNTATTLSGMVSLLTSKIDNDFTATVNDHTITVTSNPSGTPIAATVKISAAASTTQDHAISATAKIGGTPAHQHTHTTLA